MTIPSNQKQAVQVVNVGLYLAARKPFDMAMHSYKDGEHRMFLNGEYISTEQFNAKLKEVEKILRPVNYKGMNIDGRSNMNLGIRSN